ncbi:MAG: exodeoxyribonuclease VII small subunit [Candidatus Omnitrophica bacterium]|nr:exodeoxyribonuclease VII small subunit [Candidatus Omnitrophota bacterium]
MKKKEIKYSEAVEELNGILEDLQSEKVDVDELSSGVKRAIELIRFCKEKIQKTELEVTKVIKEFEQELPEGEAEKK